MNAFSRDLGILAMPTCPYEGVVATQFIPL